MNQQLVPMVVLAGIAATGIDARPAHADDATARRIAALVIQRARRSVAIGPFVGAGIQVADGGGTDGTLGFGFDLSIFKVQIVPDAETVKGIVTDRAKARVAEAIEQAAAGGRPLEGAELAATSRQIYQDVLAEFLEERTPKTFEKPRLRAMIEAGRTLDGGDWSGRLGAAVGVKPVSLGLAATTRFADETVLLLGPELTLQILPGKGPRSPIIDGYARVDFPVLGDGATLYGGGVRVILDLI